jgi:hypothetical protein
MTPTRRFAVALVALFALGGTQASAAPPRTTLKVSTVVGSRQLPRPTVSAAWMIDPDKSDRLHITGQNLPVALSTVTASWTGTRTADSRGRFLALSHGYTYDAVREGARVDIVAEYRLKGHWYRVMGLREDYVGTIGLTRKTVTEVLTTSAPTIAGKTVPVRLTLTIRFPEAAANIDDTFLVMTKLATAEARPAAR